MTLELSYSHNQNTETLNSSSRKCSICNSVKCNLIKLPDKPFQDFAKEKGYESWYCTTTCSVVNFLL